jgi:hypothetical protein
MILRFNTGLVFRWTANVIRNFSQAIFGVKNMLAMTALHLTAMCF